MFLPLKDHNPTLNTPIITLIIIAANVAIFLAEVFQGPNLGMFIARWGATPYELTHFHDLVGTVADSPVVHAPGPTPLLITALTSMFLHGGWMHLLFNMHFLWIFGNNVEDVMGSVRFVSFYAVTGLLGLLAHVATDLNSTIPTVGASGAISGMLGAYLVLFPRARISSIIFLGFFIQVVQIRAVWLIGGWFVLQLLGGLAGLGFGGSGNGGVAYWAHIGGFAAGWLGIRLVTTRPVPAEREEFFLA